MLTIILGTCFCLIEENALFKIVIQQLIKNSLMPKHDICFLELLKLFERTFGEFSDHWALSLLETSQMRLLLTA